MQAKNNGGNIFNQEKIEKYSQTYKEDFRWIAVPVRVNSCDFKLFFTKVIVKIETDEICYIYTSQPDNSDDHIFKVVEHPLAYTTYNGKGKNAFEVESLNFIDKELKLRQEMKDKYGIFFSSDLEKDGKYSHRYVEWFEIFCDQFFNQSCVPPIVIEKFNSSHRFSC